MNNKPAAFNEHVKDLNLFSQRILNMSEEIKEEFKKQKEAEIKQARIDINDEVEKKYQGDINKRDKSIAQFFPLIKQLMNTN